MYFSMEKARIYFTKDLQKINLNNMNGNILVLLDKGGDKIAYFISQNKFILSQNSPQKKIEYKLELSDQAKKSFFTYKMDTFIPSHAGEDYALFVFIESVASAAKALPSTWVSSIHKYAKLGLNTVLDPSHLLILIIHAGVDWTKNEALKKITDNMIFATSWFRAPYKTVFNMGLHYFFGNILSTKIKNWLQIRNREIRAVLDSIIAEGVNYGHDYTQKKLESAGALPNFASNSPIINRHIINAQPQAKVVQKNSSGTEIKPIEQISNPTHIIIKPAAVSSPLSHNDSPVTQNMAAGSQSVEQPSTTKMETQNSHITISSTPQAEVKKSPSNLHVKKKLPQSTVKITPNTQPKQTVKRHIDEVSHPINNLQTKKIKLSTVKKQLEIESKNNNKAQTTPKVTTVKNSSQKDAYIRFKIAEKRRLDEVAQPISAFGLKKVKLNESEPSQSKESFPSEKYAKQSDAESSYKFLVARILNKNSFNPGNKNNTNTQQPNEKGTQPQQHSCNDLHSNQPNTMLQEAQTPSTSSATASTYTPPLLNAQTVIMNGENQATQCGNPGEPTTIATYITAELATNKWGADINNWDSNLTTSWQTQLISAQNNGSHSYQNLYAVTSNIIQQTQAEATTATLLSKFQAGEPLTPSNMQILFGTPQEYVVADAYVELTNQTLLANEYSPMTTVEKVNLKNEILRIQKLPTSVQENEIIDAGELVFNTHCPLGVTPFLGDDEARQNEMNAHIFGEGRWFDTPNDIVREQPRVHHASTNFANDVINVIKNAGVSVNVDTNGQSIDFTRGTAQQPKLFALGNIPLTPPTPAPVNANPNSEKNTNIPANDMFLPRSEVFISPSSQPEPLYNFDMASQWQDPLLSINNHYLNDIVFNSNPTPIATPGSKPLYNFDMASQWENPISSINNLNLNNPIFNSDPSPTTTPSFTSTPVMIVPNSTNPANTNASLTDGLRPDAALANILPLLGEISPSDVVKTWYKTFGTFLGLVSEGITAAEQGSDHVVLSAGLRFSTSTFLPVLFNMIPQIGVHINGAIIGSEIIDALVPDPKLHREITNLAQQLVTSDSWVKQNLILDQIERLVELQGYYTVLTGPSKLKKIIVDKADHGLISHTPPPTQQSTSNTAAAELSQFGLFPNRNTASNANTLTPTSAANIETSRENLYNDELSF